MLTCAILLASSRLYLVDRQHQLATWNPGQKSISVVRTLPGEPLALSSNGAWAATDDKVPDNLVLGRDTGKLTSLHIGAALASFDASGQRLAVVEEKPPGKYRLVIVDHGKSSVLRQFNYRPAWLIWVGRHPVVPGEDGALAKAVGPVPAHVPAQHAAISRDGTTCALLIGSPGVFKVVVGTRHGKRTYAAEQGRDLPNLACDRESVYYTTLLHPSIGPAPTVETPLYRLSLKTGKSTRVVIPGVDFFSMFSLGG